MTTSTCYLFAARWRHPVCAPSAVSFTSRGFLKQRLDPYHHFNSLCWMGSPLISLILFEPICTFGFHGPVCSKPVFNYVLCKEVLPTFQLQPFA